MQQLMKKVMLLGILCLPFMFATTAQSQDLGENQVLTNKNGVRILPERGDFAIGVDASPILDYLGNFMSTSLFGNGAPQFDNMNIFGRYFIADDRAIRANLFVGISSATDKRVIRDDHAISQNPLNQNATAIDVRNTSRSQFGLALGYEFRRGKSRLQGYYGGDFGFHFDSGGRTTFDWANPMTSANRTPSSNAGFWGAGWDGSRAIEINHGNTFGIDLRGFVGVEYFFAPKMSVGAEFALGLGLSMTGQSEITTESWNNSTNSVQTESYRHGQWNARSFDFGTFPVAGGKIFLAFYF